MSDTEVIENKEEVTDTVEQDDVVRSLIGSESKRASDLNAKVIDEEKRLVSLAISSEYRVERGFGGEVLAHTSDAMDLEFLGSGRAPLLLDHDPSNQIGVVEAISLDEENGILRGKVRFSKNAKASEIFNDVVDGIRANVSVGYSIEEVEKRGQDTYVATKWRPYECSIVSIPADTTVGVGRHADSVTNTFKQSKEENTMTDKVENKENAVDVDAIRSTTRSNVQKEVSEIIALGQRHNQVELASKAIQEGKSAAEFRGQLLDVIASTKPIETEGSIGLTTKERKRYSLMKAINFLANPHDKRAREAAAFELECSAAAASQYRADPQGLMLPADVLMNWKRDLNSADDSDLFSDDYRANEFVDVLRNSSSVMQAGARMLTGLSGDVVIPKKTAASTAAWIATEGGAATQTEPTFGNIRLEPRQIGAFVDMTRQLRQQSSFDVEALIRDDLAMALALAIDLGALEGSGASGQPTGLLNQTGIAGQKVTAFAAANPTFAEVVSLETKVADANALMGNLGYISRSNMVGAMKTTEKATGTAQFLTDGTSLNGHRLITSNQGTDGNLYFGNWSDLLVGMWSGVDLTVDPYSLSTTGNVRVVAFQTADVAVRHIESFAYGNDTV